MPLVAEAEEAVLTHRTTQRYVCRAAMPNVKFVVEYQVVEVETGRALRAVALEAGINPNREPFRGVNCGGRGLCGTCKVWVKESGAGAVSPPNLREKLRGMGDGRRLACQTRVLGDIEVTTFPGGDDRLGPRRRIDPAPIRAEAQAEIEKMGAPAAKATTGGDAAPADKPVKKAEGGAKPQKTAEGKAELAAEKDDKKSDVNAEGVAKPVKTADDKAEGAATTNAEKADKRPEGAGGGTDNSSGATDATA